MIELRRFRTGPIKGYQTPAGTVMVMVREELLMPGVVMTTSEEVGQGDPAFLERIPLKFI